MPNKGKEPRITSGSMRLTLPITKITLSDDVLRNHLSKIYEAGVRDSEKFQWSDLGAVFLSISGTLLLTCLTATFNDFSSHVKFATQQCLTVIAWIAFAWSFVLGCVFICFKASRGHSDVFDSRDIAVEAGARQVLSQFSSSANAIPDDSSDSSS